MVRIAWFSLVLCLLNAWIGVFPLVAQEPSEVEGRWLAAYGEMERGRRHWLVDEYGEAASGFRAALSGFEGILRDHPSWRTDLVLFRLAYCRVKLGECEVKLSAFEHEDDVVKLRELLRHERERSGRLSGELDRLGRSQESSLSQVRSELSRVRQSYETLSSTYVRQSHAYSESKANLSRVQGELSRLRQAKSAFMDVLEERDSLRERVQSLESSLSEARASRSTPSVSESARCRDRALAAERQGDGASAARYWQLCARGGGDAISCWTRSAYWYWQVGERDKSGESLSQLFSALSASGRFWAMLSRVCLSLGEKDRGLGLASMSVAVGGEDVSSLVSLGACLMGVGDRRLSETYFRKALRLQPDHGESLWCMATLLSTYGSSRKAEARGYYDRALKSGLPRDAGMDAYFGLSTTNQSGK